MRTLTLALAFLVFAFTAHAEILPGFVYSKQLKGRDDRGSFDIQYLQISPRAFPVDGIRRHVNAQLAKIARESICDADPANRDRMDSSLRMTATFANADALAVRASQDYYCGGAHPDAGTTSYLYDLRTAELVSLESQVTDGAAFKKLVIDAVVANIPKDDGTGDCSDLYTREELEGQSYEYTVEGDRLVATQDYPHAMLACAFETAIPYSALRSLVKQGSTLARVIR